jgi:hypothetical protein
MILLLSRCVQVLLSRCVQVLLSRCVQVLLSRCVCVQVLLSWCVQVLLSRCVCVQVLLSRCVCVQVLLSLHHAALVPLPPGSVAYAWLCCSLTGLVNPVLCGALSHTYRRGYASLLSRLCAARHRHITGTGCVCVPGCTCEGACV